MLRYRTDNLCMNKTIYLIATATLTTALLAGCSSTPAEEAPTPSTSSSASPEATSKPTNDTPAVADANGIVVLTEPATEEEHSFAPSQPNGTTREVGTGFPAGFPAGIPAYENRWVNTTFETGIDEAGIPITYTMFVVNADELQKLKDSFVSNGYTFVQESEVDGVTKTTFTNEITTVVLGTSGFADGVDGAVYYEISSI